MPPLAHVPAQLLVPLGGPPLTQRHEWTQCRRRDCGPAGPRTRSAASAARRHVAARRVGVPTLGAHLGWAASERVGRGRMCEFRCCKCGHASRSAGRRRPAAAAAAAATARLMSGRGTRGVHRRIGSSLLGQGLDISSVQSSRQAATRSAGPPRPNPCPTAVARRSAGLPGADRVPMACATWPPRVTRPTARAAAGPRLPLRSDIASQRADAGLVTMISACGGRVGRAGRQTRLPRVAGPTWMHRANRREFSSTKEMEGGYMRQAARSCADAARRRVAGGRVRWRRSYRHHVGAPAGRADPCGVQPP